LVESLELFIDIMFPAALWRCDEISLWQKRLPGIFPGDKDGRWVGLTGVPRSVLYFFKNIWDCWLSGTLRACNSRVQGWLLNYSLYSLPFGKKKASLKEL